VRVAYLLDQYPAISHSFILREVAALRERGAEVHTVSIRRSDPRHLLAHDDLAEYERTLAIRPVRPLAFVVQHASALAAAPRAYLRTMLWSPTLARGLRARLWQLFYFLEAVPVWLAMRRAGIRHVHAHFTSPAADVALLVAALGGGEGNGWTWSFSAHGSDIQETDQHLLAEKVRRADGVVCVSDFGRSQLLTLVEERHWPKVAVVRCGLEAKSSADRPTQQRPDGEPLQLLNVGRMVRLKGQSVLLDAVGLLRRRGIPAVLTIVGNGPLRNELELMIERLDLASVVRLVGYVGQDDIASYYDQADVFCLPSFREGLPVVLMEAMARGLPVVASGIMGIPELVQHDRNGVLVPPGRADLLTDAIARLAIDPEERQSMGEHGRRTVLSEYDVTRSAERLYAIFSAIAAS
jgi:colanic acid/amylovoran biosynthesis glycosyltransferase